MSENQKPADTRSASQKIQDLENAAVSLYQTANNMARDLNAIKEAIKLLGNKVDSIVKASASGQAITDDVISKIMVQNNVEELAEKVKNMVAQGILGPQEQLSELSFVVGSEINELGEVVNPRLQFALQAIQPEMRGKFVGAKVGDVLNLQEGKLKFKVLELYEIQQPKAEEAAAPAEAAPSKPAPAAEQASEPVPSAQLDQSATPVS